MAANDPAPLPHNVELEQALLGAFLLNNEAVYRVPDNLLPEHFYEPLHQKIFELIVALIRADKAATPLTLKTFLPADFRVGDLTIQQYLVRLAAEATSVIMASDYASMIIDLAVRRSLITVAQDMIERATQEAAGVVPADLVEQAERSILATTGAAQHSPGPLAFGWYLGEAVDMVARAYQRDGRLSGMPTGIHDLDRMSGGLQASDLIILAARPGMGKTALATTIAYNVASAFVGEVSPDGSVKATAGGQVGYFSLEMSGEQLTTRILSSRCEIPSYRMRRGEIDPDDFARLTDAARDLERMPLYIDESGALPISKLISRARRLHRQRGIDLLVVDYLQLLSGAGRSDNRSVEIGEITGALKGLAKELKVPVIALSQLSRQVESREDKRPQLSDLRESGAIEQDADVVMFVYREEYYLRNKEPRAGTEEHFKWQTDIEVAHGKAEVIIGKHRHAPTGTINLQFDGEFTRFSDLADVGRLPERLL